ncbi:hypothetical protein HELRODRAFT_167380 [Helobdella robusta]|uniref:Heparan-alpha-glucosaminide N-acetyltransferase catalytic domain-containing protein n=1 Tax=Helobdella robusta TaxID=6412 RepID=T1EZB5_HELRO|nr:hypothetical protein HELRODRAFT_167380 [Helobdella robusta]ESO10869.1 hypothetical protein HELRODRAFT_167380 [Helobdella robusta]
MHWSLVLLNFVNLSLAGERVLPATNNHCPLSVEGRSEFKYPKLTVYKMNTALVNLEFVQLYHSHLRSLLLIQADKMELLDTGCRDLYEQPKDSNAHNQNHTHIPRLKYEVLYKWKSSECHKCLLFQSKLFSHVIDLRDVTSSADRKRFIEDSNAAATTSIFKKFFRNFKNRIEENAATDNVTNDKKDHKKPDIGGKRGCKHYKYNITNDNNINNSNKDIDNINKDNNMTTRNIDVGNSGDINLNNSVLSSCHHRIQTKYRNDIFISLVLSSDHDEDDDEIISRSCILKDYSFLDKGEYYIEVSLNESTLALSCRVQLLNQPTDSFLYLYAVLLFYVSLTILWTTKVIIVKWNLQQPDVPNPRSATINRYKNIPSDNKLNALDVPLTDRLTSKTTVKIEIENFETLEEDDQNLKSVIDRRWKFLDAYRGYCLTMLIFQMYGSGDYPMFQHSTWTGFRYGDTFGLSLSFILGVSLTLAYKDIFKSETTRLAGVVCGIFVRWLKLFTLGMFVNSLQGKKHVTKVRGEYAKVYLPNDDIAFDHNGILGTFYSSLVTFAGLQLIASVLLCNGDALSGFIPISKELCSLTFCLLTCCLNFFILGLAYLTIDVARLWNGRPFIYPGLNVIFIYVCASCFKMEFPISWLLASHDDEEQWKLLILNCWSTSFWVVVSYAMFTAGVIVNV